MIWIYYLNKQKEIKIRRKTQKSKIITNRRSNKKKRCSKKDQRKSKTP